MRHDEVTKLAALEDRHWWYAERRSLVSKQLKRLGPPKPGDQALDIGSAAGGNSAVLARHGWSVTAADLSTTAVTLAASRGIRVVNSDITRLPVKTESLGLVTAFDVLEHVPDDKSAIGEIYRVLRRGATTLITVPASMSLWSQHDVAVGHVRRYSRAELISLVAGSGLRIADVFSWNVLLRPIAAWRRRQSTGSDLDRPAAVVNAGLRAIVAAERVLPVGRMPGVSLVLRAHKA
ncbi:methyltransferase domain-containing protein [Actinoplanes sp. TBRC 11911]|uniref:class I SAM-dependent methyltransferase n=1 Tax=Actinoplanes sp. TBRC 11911 TaxID=2729386 RepID=UPI00145E5779|nr:class I SAM-dependent methyltransferase [Actinoplanes sp. TBRC 11911]NMO56900.1 methyltransferase domain-containing protein [Actinoplanes sp. TBRC 11911]